MKGKSVFVTVGTTKFDELIETVSKTDTLNILHSLGYTSIQFQVGNGEFLEKKHDKIHLKYEKYFENFSLQIERSDLIISHAGAGTCIEVLQNNKPLIVVINESLMNNHQSELAQKLAQEGYLFFCTTKSLKNTLLNFDLSKLRSYSTPDINIFSQYLDKCMGFI